MKSFGIDESFIDKIKQNSNIVSVLNKYIPLEKKGGSFWACCPFHYEKTPSFAVNEREQYYHCFGCGESGDVITFIRKYENVDFIKACEILAKDAGIEMPEKVFDENIGKLKKAKDTVFNINKDSAKFYNKTLFSSKGEVALNYLLGRNITKESIIKFGLGYSSDWTDLINHLKKLGYTEEEMVDAGVAETKNGRTFDSFCERIMFPILNSYGDVVGFSGRTMSKETNIAKYRNTRETLVFEKSKSIFAINLLKKFKQENPLSEIILAEGQIDVIKLHQAGFNNAVACMGTALTVNHAKELKRFSEKVVVCFDGDSAGQKATLRSLDILSDEGLYVSVVTLPEGMDPDEFLSKFGKDKLKLEIEKAMPVVDFKLFSLSKKYNLENNYEKVKFKKEALDVLRNQPSLTDAEIYLSTLNKLSGVSKDLLRQELNIKPTKTPELNNLISSQDNGYVSASKFICGALLHKKDYAFIPDNEFFYFMNGDLNNLLAEIKKGIIISNIFSIFNIEESPIIKSIIDFDHKIENEKQFYKDSINHILKTNMQKKLDELMVNLKTASDDTRGQLLKQIQELTLMIKNGGFNG